MGVSFDDVMYHPLTVVYTECAEHIDDIKIFEKTSLFSQVDMIQWSIIWNYITTIELWEHATCKTRQMHKFDVLYHKRYPGSQLTVKHETDAVLNLSRRTLSTCEHDLLSKGLDFVVFPRKVNHMKIAMNTEYANLKSKNKLSEAATLIQDACMKHDRGRENLSFPERQALRTLSKDDTICILKADKGKKVVVMDTDEYFTKLDNIVRSTSYTKIPKDPTTKLDNQIRLIVRRLKKNPNIPRRLAYGLVGDNTRHPAIYGAPKIHKDGIPLRPVVSTFGSVYENVAKTVSRILRNYCKDMTDTLAVDNSLAVLKNIKALDDTDGSIIMVSFDVINMFGTLCINDCKRVIHDLIQADPHFETRFNFDMATFFELLDICLQSSFFKYKGEFYVQTEGLPMGSPSSQIIAELYMRHIEIKVQQLDLYRLVRLWNRYVDDILTIWCGNTDQLRSFFDQLNLLDSHIKFTMVTEKNNQLPFLDLMFTKDANKISSSIYYKPVDSEIMINYNSFQPPAVKQATLKGEVKRYNRLSDNVTDDLHTLRKRFIRNSFPANLVDEACKRKPDMGIAITQPLGRSDTGRTFACLPYLGKLSTKLTKKARKNDVQIANTRDLSLGAIFGRTYKYKTPITTNVVYEVPCKCGDTYIGETGQPLSKRLEQHRYAIKTYNQFNGIAVHVNTSGHMIDWANTKVLDQEPNYHKRKFLEGLYIRTRRPPLNLNSGATLKCHWRTDFLRQTKD